MANMGKVYAHTHPGQIAEKNQVFFMINLLIYKHNWTPSD